MNYGQFLNMIPEALLVLALIIVFFADFCLHKSERKTGVLGSSPLPCCSARPSCSPPLALQRLSAACTLLVRQLRS